jgi:hypothetical protein
MPFSMRDNIEKLLKCNCDQQKMDELLYKSLYDSSSKFTYLLLILGANPNTILNTHYSTLHQAVHLAISATMVSSKDELYNKFHHDSAYLNLKLLIMYGGDIYLKNKSFINEDCLEMIDKSSCMCTKDINDTPVWFSSNNKELSNKLKEFKISDKPLKINNQKDKIVFLELYLKYIEYQIAMNQLKLDNNNKYFENIKIVYEKYNLPDTPAPIIGIFKLLNSY